MSRHFNEKYIKKSFKNRKGDWRKSAYKSFPWYDPTCRPGGSCGWCSEGRQHKNRKQLLDTQEQIDDFSPYY